MVPQVITRLKNRLVFAILTGFSSLAYATEDKPARYDFPTPVTEMARTQLSLHHLSLWICLAIALVVFGFMFYSMYAHRKSRGAVPAEFHENTTVEVLWTVVPFTILIAMAIPATKSLIDYENSTGSDMTVKVIGHQWYWEYEYVDPNTPDKDLNKPSKLRYKSNILPEHKEASLRNKDVKNIKNYLLEVDEPLVLPVNKRVRFLFKSEDVIHAWWVPQFGVKKDAIPGGYVTNAWTKVDKEGTYRGQCAELCGTYHAYMPIVVKVVSETEFTEWQTRKVKELSAGTSFSATSASKEELMTLGKKSYETSCGGCHGMKGEGVGKTFPPLAGNAVANGDAKKHIDAVLKGRPGTSMGSFKSLSDSELAAIITYERNAWGNKGSVVQPAQVKAAR